MNNPDERIKSIAFNMAMMDRSLDTLPERVAAQMSAASDVTEAYLSGREQSGEIGDLPPYFDDAVSLAITQVYKAGNPDFGDDLKRHIDIFLEYRRLKQASGSEPITWLPETEEELALVHTLSQTASLLGIKDYEPVFQPNVNSGRDWEIMDPFDCWYNKFGFYITNSQRMGSFQ